MVDLASKRCQFAPSDAATLGSPLSRTGPPLKWDILSVDGRRLPLQRTIEPGAAGKMTGRGKVGRGSVRLLESQTGPDDEGIVGFVRGAAAEIFQVAVKDVTGLK